MQVSTFYLSRIIGNPIAYGDTDLGKLKDVIVSTDDIRPRVIALEVKKGKESTAYDFSGFTLMKKSGQYYFTCKKLAEYGALPENALRLVKNILDRQIIDMDGHKVVRVNDIRMAFLPKGTYAVAVDVGLEGLLRRLGIAKLVKRLLRVFGRSMSTQLIIWDDVETVDAGQSSIRLAKTSAKLETLHPSDLADIIEDLNKPSQIAIFSSLDEEKAADVLEEMESETQIQVIANLSIEKAADVLEKMPADEVADILDELEEDVAEQILREMGHKASAEVRELMDYPDDTVGSIMSTDYIAFHRDQMVEAVLQELRRLKPAADSIYYLYIVDDAKRLLATVSLRDLVIADPATSIAEIMNENLISVYDSDDMHVLQEVIGKYGLLAVPVVDTEQHMIGTVVVDDIVYNLLKAKRRRR